MVKGKGLKVEGASPFRRPALLLLFLGCGVSFLASGAPSARLIADGALSFAFVPFCELAGLAASLRVGHRRVPLASAIDPFFAGNAPWLLWIVIVSLASTIGRPILWTSVVLAVSAVAPAILRKADTGVSRSETSVVQTTWASPRAYRLANAVACGSICMG